MRARQYVHVDSGRLVRLCCSGGRQIALFVNATTMLPVFTPFASAGTVLDRFPGALGVVFRADGVPESVVDREVAETPCGPLSAATSAPTANSRPRSPRTRRSRPSLNCEAVGTRRTGLPDDLLIVSWSLSVERVMDVVFDAGE